MPHAKPSTILPEDLTPGNFVVCSGLNLPIDDGKVYEVAIYYGTGAGQFRTISDADSGVGGFFMDTPLSPALDSTSEFMV